MGAPRERISGIGGGSISHHSRRRLIRKKGGGKKGPRAQKPECKKQM